MRLISQTGGGVKEARCKTFPVVELNSYAVQTEHREYPELRVRPAATQAGAGGHWLEGP